MFKIRSYRIFISHLL